MSDIIKTVSQLIENQFPAVYREEGPQLVAFVKAYFEFLENDEESSTKLARQLFDVNDIDNTLNSFIVNYKEKYLKDFPFKSSTDKRFMIKHIMDYYRSKGSTQSIELLMKMLYGEEIEVYYPSQDILKPSESKWLRPSYIEVNKSKRTAGFVDKQVRGSRSGATAFVEAIVTKRANGKLIDVVYLSDVRGTFLKNDFLSDDGVNKNAPKVLGSLSDISIELGGKDNIVGDTFDVETVGGVQGKVRITEIENATGRVNFKLENGGGGYTTRKVDGTQQTDIYVSDTVLDVKNPDLDFIRFEKIEQPIETLYLLSSSDISEDVALYDYVSGYSAAADFVANGIVIESSNTYANGDIIPATSQVIGISVAASTFTSNEVLTSSGNGNATIVGQADQNLTLSINSGVFLNGETITGAVSGTTATVSSSVPGTKLKVLVTDQTFANQCLVTLSSDTSFQDGEVIEEEGIVKLSIENETGAFTVGNVIKQYELANTDFSAVETFAGNAVLTTFTHTANLEASDSVTVIVDNVIQAVNTDYVLSEEDVVFHANSIPSDAGSNNVLISAKSAIQKTVKSAQGTLTANGELQLDSNIASFNAGDTILHETTGATANVALIEDGVMYFDTSTGYFTSGGKIQVQGTSTTNATITSTSVILSPAWGSWVSETLIKQGSIEASTEENGVYVDTSNAQWVGARGIVQNDGTLAADEVVIMDLFGEFNTSKKVRGDKTRKIATIATITPTGAARIRLNGDVNANGNVDGVTNNYVVGTLVGQNTTAIGISYDDANVSSRDTFTSNEAGDITINTRRDLMITPPKFAVSDLTFNLDTTQEFAELEVIDSITDAQKGRHALFEAFVQFPQPLATGTLFELGGSTIGTSLQIIEAGGVKLLRFRSGTGSASDTTTGNYLAVIDVALADLPSDKNYHVLVWYVNPNNGNIRLWIDGVSKGNQTASNSKLGDANGTWAGSNAGRYGAISDDVAGGNTGTWKGEVFSKLKYFDKGSANTFSTSGQIMQLTGEKVFNVSTGVSASFDIETLSNVDTFTLNTDFVGANNVSLVNFRDIKIDGSGSGVGFVDSFTITSGGANYSPNDPIVITGGGLGGGDVVINAEAQVSGVDGTGAITQITVTTQGEGYWGTPTFAITSSGTGANISINMDHGYGFPKNADGDLSNLLIDLLTFEEFEIGTVSTLGSINPGAAYNRDPFVVLYNKYIASYRRGDFIITLENVTGSYRVGELLAQTVVGVGEFTKGKVISWDFDEKILQVERTSFEVGFDPTLAVVGKTSNASGDVVTISGLENQNIMGDNAFVSSDVISANGIATAVEIIDSGYGYITDGNVTLTSDDTPFIISGKSKAQTQGISEGFWASTDSHLNSEKKIHDNKYYQEFSYDVLSGLSLRRYENLLKRVLHVSGTELFGTVVKRSDIPLQISTPSSNSSITVE